MRSQSWPPLPHSRNFEREKAAAAVFHTSTASRRTKARGCDSRSFAKRFGTNCLSSPQIAARSRQIRDEPGADRVSNQSEDDRDDRCRLLCRDDRCGSRCDNDIDLEPDKLGRNLGGALAASLRPAVLDRNIATLGPAELAKPLHKNGGPLALSRSRIRAQETDGRHLRRLLCARGERPKNQWRDRRAAESGDEFAAPHSITSSARASKVGGTSRPSTLAVLRLMASSNLVGACTGRSAGLAPFSIRSTYSAARGKVSPRSTP